MFLQEFIYVPVGAFYALYFYHREHPDHERYDWYYFQACLFSMQGPIGWNWVNLIYLVYKVNYVDKVYNRIYRNIIIAHFIFNVYSMFWSTMLVGWIWQWWYMRFPIYRKDKQPKEFPEEDWGTPLRA